MTEDEIFIDLAKTAIDKYPTITGRCHKCPIRFIENNAFYRDKIRNKYEYLNKNAEYGGSTCFFNCSKNTVIKNSKS